MRLERLEVPGFGGLRDRTVDFHSRLTLVLGDNESGKSTLHRAVRAALYGIDAGGQGRPVERSDWARWTPWTAGPYGVALTYTLEDGRRIRVARRLDTREQGVQVLELGGSDLTDEVRSGRAVSPGRFHLGVDESVFCASAWLGDEALRLGAPDAAPARAENLQEAIERLADTRRGITATQAVARLREAIDRVGSERRSTSPLGVAAARLRELDRHLDDARRRLAALSTEEERLRRLERSADAARERALEAARAWLVGRLEVIADRRRLLVELADEIKQHALEAEGSREFAAFPLDLEERSTSLGGELAHALLNAGEARARWDAARDTLQAVRRRRAEIASGLSAIAPVAFDEDTVEQANRLHGELSAVVATAQRLDAGATSDTKAAALRHEIAATGMGALPLGSADALAALLAQARNRHSPVAWLAAAFGCVAAGGVAAVQLAGHRTWGVLAAVIVAALVAGGGCAAGFRRSRRHAAQARERLTELERAAGVDAADVEAAAARVPSLQALHEALLREQARSASRRADVDAIHATAAALLERCRALALSAGLTPPDSRAGATTMGLLEEARETLAGFERAATARRRRAELENEDRRLAAEETEQRRLEDEAQRCARVAEQLQERLAQMLVSAGLRPRTTPTEAVAAVREACAERRRHDAAIRALNSARQRAGMLGEAELLEKAYAHVAGELRARGGGGDIAEGLVPPDEVSLQRLEDAARHASQAAIAQSTQARELGARLAGLLESAPDVADLENERDAYAAARERGMRQLTALNRAVDLIEQASRITHRDLAPQLAERVAGRLSTLTDARYEAVNIDTEHFTVSLLGRERPDMVSLELLSHGTRDQVSLLLRVALCEVLSAGEPLPLLLDEPMLTADPARRDLMLEFLHRLSETNQVVVTTSDPAVMDAVRRAGADEYSVVHLSPEPVAEVSGRHSARVRVL
jgi:DNA repair protein SbcC/Rad50